MNTVAQPTASVDAQNLDKTWRRLSAYFQTRTEMLHRADARKIAHILRDVTGMAGPGEPGATGGADARLPKWAIDHVFETRLTPVVDGGWGGTGKVVGHSAAMRGNLMDTLFWNWGERGGERMGERYKVAWFALIQWAVRAGFSATEVNDFGVPLNNMAVAGGIPGLRALREVGVDLASAGPNGRTPAHALALNIIRDDPAIAPKQQLSEARRARYAETLRWLAREAPDSMDKRDDEGRTPRDILGARFAYVLDEPEQRNDFSGQAQTPPAGVFPGMARVLR